MLLQLLSLIGVLEIQNLTLEHGADLLPGGHPTLAGVLAQGQSQEEQGHSAEEEGEAVGDEDGTYRRQQSIQNIPAFFNEPGESFINVLTASVVIKESWEIPQRTEGRDLSGGTKEEFHFVGPSCSGLSTPL